MRAISKELKAQVEEEINIQQVIKNPSASQGKMVIWGGAIVTAKNMKEGTVFEIVQKPLSSEERPLNVDRSDGRFLALYDGYLDVAIYSKGREVTVAGTIKETKKQIVATFSHRRTERSIPIEYSEDEVDKLQDLWQSHLTGLNENVSSILPANIADVVSHLNAWLAKAGVSK